MMMTPLTPNNKPAFMVGYKEKPFIGKKGFELYLILTENQVNWIEYCENNGISYAGPNGLAIRQADKNELERLKERFSYYEKMRNRRKQGV